MVTRRMAAVHRDLGLQPSNSERFCEKSPNQLGQNGLDNRHFDEKFPNILKESAFCLRVIHEHENNQIRQKYENSGFLCDHKLPEHDAWTFKNRLCRETAAADGVVSAARRSASPIHLHD